jgi:hypothetical protein
MTKDYVAFHHSQLHWLVHYHTEKQATHPKYLNKQTNLTTQHKNQKENLQMNKNHHKNLEHFMNYKAPHYIIFSSLMLLSLPMVQHLP